MVRAPGYDWKVLEKVWRDVAATPRKDPSSLPLRENVADWRQAARVPFPGHERVSFAGTAAGSYVRENPEISPRRWLPLALRVSSFFPASAPQRRAFARGNIFPPGTADIEASEVCKPLLRAPSSPDSIPPPISDRASRPRSFAVSPSGAIRGGRR